MKKIQLISLLVFYVPLIFAQEPVFSNQNESLPLSMGGASALHVDSVKKYNWGNCWTAVSKEKYTYTNGNLTEYLLYDGNQNLTTRDKYKYNANSNVISKIHDANLNSTAPHSTYYEYKYDSNSNLILQVQTDTMSITNFSSYRDSIVYTNNLKTYRQLNYYSNNVLSSSTYFEWTYGSDSNPTKMEQGYINSGTKSVSQKEEYEYANGDLVSSSISSWNSTLLDWVYTNKISYTYNSEHKLIKREYYTYTNSTWVKSNAYEYTYDAKGNNVKTIYSIPSENGSEMIPVYQEIATITDDNAVIQNQRFYWTFYGWKSTAKTIYFMNSPQDRQVSWGEACTKSNKFSADLKVASCPTGIDTKVDVAAGISVFPNPSYGNFTLSFTNPKEGTYKINVFSSDGKLVYNGTISVPSASFTQTISLKSTGGIYYLQVWSDKEVYKEKIIVQPY